MRDCCYERDTGISNFEEWNSGNNHLNFFLKWKNKLSRPKPRLIEYRNMKNFDNAVKKRTSGHGVLFLGCGRYLRSLGALCIRTFLTGMRRSRKNGCARINYPRSHLKFNTKLPGAIGCLNATGRTELTTSGLSITTTA